MDILKLDRGLVDGVVESARLHKITTGLLKIAGDLGLESVAEGVDLPEQVVALRAMGCTHGQGMAFSGPLDEFRLRRALVRGSYPLPGGAQGAPGVPRPVLSGGSLPVRYTRPPGTDRIPYPSIPASRSNNETPVPPT